MINRIHQLRQKQEKESQVQLRDKPQINKRSQQLAKLRKPADETAAEKIQRFNKNIIKNNIASIKELQKKLALEKGWNYAPKIDKKSRKIYINHLIKEKRQ